MTAPWGALVGAAAVLHLASVVSSPAAEVDLGTLGASGGEKLRFASHFENPLFPYAPGALIPELCSDQSCHTYAVTIDASAHARDVAIAIGWIGEDQESDLYVYGPDDDARLAGSSTGLASQGESVVLRSPLPGRYRIVVAAARVASMDYSGIAQVQDPLRPHPTRDLLPALVTPPPSDFHVSGLPLVPSTSLGFVVPAGLLPPLPRPERRSTCS